MLGQVGPEWSTVVAGAVGAGAVLVAALIEKLRVGEKRRWEDEFVSASAEFLAEARRLHTIALRLDPEYERPHHIIVDRDAGLRDAEERYFKMRDIYQRIRLLGPRAAQEEARYAMESAWILLEVNGYGKADERLAEWGNVPVARRLEDRIERFIVEARRAVRVQRRPWWRKQVLLEADIRSARLSRGGKPD